MKPPAAMLAVVCAISLAPGAALGQCEHAAWPEAGGVVLEGGVWEAASAWVAARGSAAAGWAAEVWSTGWSAGWGWASGAVSRAFSVVVGAGLGAGELTWSLLTDGPRPSAVLVPEPGLYRPALGANCPCGAPSPAWALRERGDAPDRLIILVHGLDEPGCVWDSLAPGLAGAGYEIARFEYPNDQPIGESADLLRAELNRLGLAGVAHADFVAHSMGGLVVLDALTTRASAGTPGAITPRVGSVITFGTPYAGSPFARARAITEAREQLTRWRAADHPWPELVGGLRDGRGEAGRDLLPESSYLIELSARELPAGVAWTSVAGVLIGEAECPVLADAVGVVRESLGDGVVSLGSAAAGPAGELVIARGSHRGILESPESGALPLILDRLGPVRVAFEPAHRR